MVLESTISANVYEGISKKITHIYVVNEFEYFQHDGALSHTAKWIKIWLMANGTCFIIRLVAWFEHNWKFVGLCKK